MAAVRTAARCDPLPQARRAALAGSQRWWRRSSSSCKRGAASSASQRWRRRSSSCQGSRGCDLWKAWLHGGVTTLAHGAPGDLMWWYELLGCPPQGCVRCSGGVFRRGGLRGPRLHHRHARRLQAACRIAQDVATAAQRLRAADWSTRDDAAVALPRHIWCPAAACPSSMGIGDSASIRLSAQDVADGAGVRQRIPIGIKQCGICLYSHGGRQGNDSEGMVDAAGWFISVWSGSGHICTATWTAPQWVW